MSAKTPEERREYYRAYNEKNSEAIRGKRHAFYLANSQRIKEARQMYRIANREKIRERARLYYKDNRDSILEKEHGRYKARVLAVRAQQLVKKYGLTPEQVDDMLAAQGGVCAICGGGPDGRWGKFNVDHNHTTGNVRGLLCSNCNQMIGHAKDSPALLRLAADYLERKDAAQ